MTNHLNDAKRILRRDYVGREDREFAVAHALVAIAEHMAGLPGPGRCGHMAPTLVPLERQVYCALPARHQGWHRGDDGSEWNEDSTCDELLAAALQALAEVRKLVEYAELSGQTVLAVDAVRSTVDAVRPTVDGR